MSPTHAIAAGAWMYVMSHHTYPAGAARRKILAMMQRDMNKIAKHRPVKK